jgi:hypothetical protein
MKQDNDLTKAFQAYIELREQREKEVKIFDSLFNAYTPVKCNDMNSNDILSHTLKMTLAFVKNTKPVSKKISVSCTWLSVRKLVQSVLRCYKHSLFNTSSSLIAIQPSRLASLGGVTLKEKIKSACLDYSGSSDVADLISCFADDDFLAITSRHSLEHLEIPADPIFGSKLDILLMVASTSLLDLVRCLSFCLKHRVPIATIVDLVILCSFSRRLSKISISKALFLTSNSRLIDISLVACSVGSIKVYELLHGVPSLYNYARNRILKKLSCGNYMAFRQTPVYGFCEFSQSLGGLYYSFKRPESDEVGHPPSPPSFLSNNLKISREHSKILLFAGGTSHANSYLKSGIYCYERYLLDELCNVAPGLRIIYVPHPAERPSSHVLNFNPRVEVSRLSFYIQLSAALGVLTVLSSVAWEAVHFGRPALLCCPMPELLFSDTELSLVSSFDSLESSTVKTQLRAFVERSVPNEAV